MWLNVFAIAPSSPFTVKCMENSKYNENTVQQKYFWYHYDNIGFPKKVNHAVALHIDEKTGNAYVYSIGGLIHADLVMLLRNYYFKSSDIDVHKFDITSRSWELVKTRSKKDDPYLAPCAKSRYGHSVCSYNGKIYVFGGRNDDDGLIKPMSCLDIATNSWVSCLTSGIVPEARDGHGCTMIGPIMFIHGGSNEIKSRFTNTLYGLNLDTLVWENYPRKGVHVMERDFHTATAVGKNKIIIFGGRSDQMGPISSGYEIYDDKFYCYDLRDKTWSEMITTGYNPGGRQSHSAAYFRESVIYFGGFNARQKKHFGDLFILNGNTYHITEVRPWGHYPCARRRYACALVGTEMIICGGTNPEIMEGKVHPILVEHSDTYILSLFPSLQELCISFINASDMDYSSLPLHFHQYLKKLDLLADKRNKTELFKDM